MSIAGSGPKSECRKPTPYRSERWVVSPVAAFSDRPRQAGGFEPLTFFGQ